MSELVADCPRCGAKKITFDLTEQLIVFSGPAFQTKVEAFCVCRHCQKSTIFLLETKNTNYRREAADGLQHQKEAVNRFVEVVRYIGTQDNTATKPPEHLPEDINAVYEEGAACMAIGCNNAAAAMFRLCLDLATKSLLPEQAEGLNSATRRNLGLRLSWLFDNGLLPEGLRELSECIKDDGNDGAHDGTLSVHDAEDIADFTFELLERLYTEPEKLKIAKQRREERRKPKATPVSAE